VAGFIEERLPGHDRLRKGLPTRETLIRGDHRRDKHILWQPQPLAALALIAWCVLVHFQAVRHIGGIQPNTLHLRQSELRVRNGLPGHRKRLLHRPRYRVAINWSPWAPADTAHRMRSKRPRVIQRDHNVRLAMGRMRSYHVVAAAFQAQRIDCVTIASAEHGPLQAIVRPQRDLVPQRLDTRHIDARLRAVSRRDPWSVAKPENVHCSQPPVYCRSAAPPCWANQAPGA